MLPIFGAREIRNTPSLSHLRLSDYLRTTILKRKISTFCQQCVCDLFGVVLRTNCKLFLCNNDRYIFGRDSVLTARHELDH
jgi:hypothetical protein